MQIDILYQNIFTLSRPEMCVQWEILLGGASFVSLAGQHTFLLTKLR